MTKIPYDLITVLGPTASGKTRVATRLADRLHTEIISADSRQVYIGMDIGTGKDLADYRIEDRQVPYHLIDIVPAGTRYNLYQYQQDFHKAYHSIEQKQCTPVLCGGTGLYIEAVLSGYQLRSRTQSERPLRSLNIGMELSREMRRERITRRLYERLDEGMLDEVRGLLAQGVSPQALIHYGLEYKYLTLHLLGELSYDDMVKQLEIAIHQFGKRQMTWFRGMQQRRGFDIHWIDATLDDEEKIRLVFDLLSS
ncbi:MAG: tRNA (adenosine(37)-N6)-dimethylallyltransferase MiaA [Mediterranea sp.]|jgi:tRNA dimethylallyltransferase|nr:tRNA (adenosine(37)-N6)-dimethylallyltransferase MiaA [Mediterranea sp.]